MHPRYTLSNEAIQVIECHDARLFLQDCVIQLLRQGERLAASAAFKASVAWVDAKSLLINCRSPTDAKPLRQQYRFLIDQAARHKLERILLGWANCDRPYVFLASMREGEFSIPPLRADKPEIAALRISEIMSESEFPMGLIELELDDQVWANKALADLKGTTIEACRRENVRRLWKPEALEQIKTTLKQQSELIHRDEADLNPGDTRHFYSRFELVIDNRYRLTTLYEWERLTVTT